MTQIELLLIAVALGLAAVVLMVSERIIRLRKAAAETERERANNQQVSALREELASTSKAMSRKRDIADRIPAIAKKITEKLPESSFAPVLVRSVKDLFDASQIGFFSPVEGSTDYTLEVGTGYPAD
jgi:hypothetical protein